MQVANILCIYIFNFHTHWWLQKFSNSENFSYYGCIQCVQVQGMFVHCVQDEVQGEWSLQVKLGCWQGTSNLYNGINLCDQNNGFTCDPYFSFCLQPSSVSPSGEYCPWGSYTSSQSLVDNDSFCFVDSVGSLSITELLNITDPLVFNVSGPYPVRWQVYSSNYFDSLHACTPQINPLLF